MCGVVLFLCSYDLLIRGLQNQTCVRAPQGHGWRVGDCTLTLPFMCQKKGKVKETPTQVGCRFEDVSSVSLT